MPVVVGTELGTDRLMINWEVVVVRVEVCQTARKVDSVDVWQRRQLKVHVCFQVSGRCLLFRVLTDGVCLRHD